MKRNNINTGFVYCTGKGADFCEFCERSVRYYREAWDAVRSGTGFLEDRGADFITHTDRDTPETCRAYLPAIVPEDWEKRIPRPEDYLLVDNRDENKAPCRRTSKK